MSKSTFSEKLSSAKKQLSNATQKALDKVEKGSKERGIIAIFKDGVGIKDDTWQNFKNQISAVLIVFAAACMVCFAVFTIMAVAMFVVGFVESGCLYRGNEIGLGEGAQILRPFYTTLLKYFYGENGYGGLVREVRNSILLNRNFQLAKILVIILAIVFLGFNYMVGVAELKTKDVISVIFKLVFVSFITDAKSINFHDQVIMKTLTETLEYIGMFFQKIILNASLQTLGQSLPPSVVRFFNANANANSANNGTLVVFDMMFGVIFSKPFFFKMFSLYGLSAIYIPVIIFTVVLAYFLSVTMAKVIMYLLFLKIAIGTSFIMMPIFMCLLLFENTKKTAVSFMEDGLIEPMFNYIFTIMFVSLFIFVSLGYLGAMLNFEVCSLFTDVKAWLDPQSLVFIALFAILCPPCMMLFLFKSYVAVGFNFATYMENSFYFAVSLLVITYNLEGIQSMADKLSNAFNFNPNSNRKKNTDGSTAFGRGAAKFSGAMANAVPTREDIIGKYEKGKDGKLGQIKGGLLQHIDKMYGTKMANAVHGPKGVTSNIISQGGKAFDYAKEKFKEASNKLSEASLGKVQNTYGSGPGLTSLYNKAGKAYDSVSNYFSGPKQSEHKKFRNENFGSKKDFQNFLDFAKTAEYNFKEKNGIDEKAKLNRAQYLQFRNETARDAEKNNGLLKSDIMKQLDFVKFEHIGNREGDKSRIENCIINAKNKNMSYASAFIEAKQNFLKSQPADMQSTASKYFEDRTKEMKMSVGYDSVVKLADVRSLNDENAIKNAKDKALNNMLMAEAKINKTTIEAEKNTAFKNLSALGVDTLLIKLDSTQSGQAADFIEKINNKIITQSYNLTKDKKAEDITPEEKINTLQALKATFEAEAQNLQKDLLSVKDEDVKRAVESQIGVISGVVEDKNDSIITKIAKQIQEQKDLKASQERYNLIKQAGNHENN